MGISNFLSLAREARAENNAEDAKKYYEKVREEDPESVEAKFFQSYYSMYEGKNGEVPSRFIKLCKSIETSMIKLKTSDMTTEEQVRSLSDIVTTFAPETGAIYSWMSGKTYFEQSDYKAVAVAGMETLCYLGSFAEEYSRNKEAEAVALKAWKEYVNLAQTKFFFNESKEKVEGYVAKIKKYEPSYEPPKRPGGCSSK